VIPPEGEEGFKTEDALLRAPLQVVTDEQGPFPARHQDRFLHIYPARPTGEAGGEVEKKNLENRRTRGKEKAGIAVGTEKELFISSKKGVFQLGQQDMPAFRLLEIGHQQAVVTPRMTVLQAA
jgi:hypothetical protein